MRFLTADYIFTVHDSPLKNGIVTVDDNGFIKEVFSEERKHQLDGAGDNIEKFNGIICPGFINAHCHLELSYLKGKMSRGKGLPDFIEEIVHLRNDTKWTKDQKQSAIERAEDEMIAGGIAGVGDICNTSDT